MAADTQRKAYRYTCNMVRPQIYSEKSLMESVVDFFSDVVPQAYTGTQKNEDKEKIQWVRFENCDCNDVAKNPDMFRSDTKGLPLLLILGYSNGVQIWNITPNGEAQEILSMRQGPVRICRLLPNPDPVLGHTDSYASKRPLVVLCDSSSAGQPYCGVKFVSLKTGDEVHSISFKTLPVQNIECNKRFLVIVFLEKICVYEACQFQQLFWVTSCFPCSGPNVNPIALSSRWLAYADKRLVAMHQSCGGMSGDGSQSYAATVLSAAKGAFKGLSMFGEAMVSSVTGTKATPPKREYIQLDNGNRPGIVTVLDIQNIHNDHFNVNEDNEGDGLIAHFHAHANEPVSNLAFDPTGTLLVTACKLGHNFHVFRLMAHPVSSSLGAVHHLYTLHRGETTAKVIDISFNHDSRWITVSSHRGTTHLFPITPYGGSVNVRTHCKPHVVNRASRFHRSAGLDEFDHSVGRRSPVLSTSPSSSGQYDRYPTLIQQNTLNNNMGNPRLPPYPHPITIYPAFQVKQPLNVVLNPGNKNQSPSHSPTGFDNVYCVCAKFCTPRLCVVGSPKLDMERREAGKRPVDSLFVMAQSGTLVEYVLEPRAKSVTDKVTDDCLLELNVVGRMQWNLQRLKNSQELRPPLPSNSPLILAHEAVTSQIPTAPDLYDLPGLTRQDSKDSLSSDHSGKEDSDEQWLSQVEIITHAGPHRRLWMGPQFSFKTYQENTTVLSSTSSSLLSQSPESNMAAMDLMGDEGDLESLKVQPTRSNPVSMPNARPAYRRLSGSDSSPVPGQSVGAQSVPMVIEAGSFDQSPHLLDVYSNWTESSVAKQPRGSDDLEEDRLKETLADAMVESPCKDIEKLSLRHQDIPRTSVKPEKSRSQTARSSTSGYTSDKADVGCIVKDSGEVDPENKVVSRKEGEDTGQKNVNKTSVKSTKKSSNEGKSIKDSVKCESSNVESCVADKCQKGQSEVKETKTSIESNKNGKKKGKAKKSLDSQLNNTSKSVAVEKADNNTDIAEKEHASPVENTVTSSTSKAVDSTAASDKELHTNTNSKKQSNKNGSNSGKYCASPNECTTVPSEIEPVSEHCPELKSSPNVDTVEMVDDRKCGNGKSDETKKNGVCEKVELVSKSGEDKSAKPETVVESDEKLSTTKSKSKKKNKKQVQSEMYESILTTEEVMTSLPKEDCEQSNETIEEAKESKSNEYEIVEEKKSAEVEIVSNDKKTPTKNSLKNPVTCQTKEVCDETFDVSSVGNNSDSICAAKMDTSIQQTEQKKEENVVEMDFESNFAPAKSKKKKRKENGNSKRGDEKSNAETVKDTENQTELKSEKTKFDSVVNNDISSVSLTSNSRSKTVSVDVKLEVEETGLEMIDKDITHVENKSKYFVESMDHLESNNVKQEKSAEIKETANIASSNTDIENNHVTPDHVAENKKDTSIDRTEMTEVTSKKKRKKKKNGMDESVYVEKSETVLKVVDSEIEKTKDESEKSPKLAPSLVVEKNKENEKSPKLVTSSAEKTKDEREKSPKQAPTSAAAETTKDGREKSPQLAPTSTAVEKTKDGRGKSPKVAPSSAVASTAGNENIQVLAKERHDDIVVKEIDETNGNAIKQKEDVKTMKLVAVDSSISKTKPDIVTKKTHSTEILNKLDGVKGDDINIVKEKQGLESKLTASSNVCDNWFDDETTVVVQKKKSKKKKKNAESKVMPTEKSPEREIIDCSLDTESMETLVDNSASDQTTVDNVKSSSNQNDVEILADTTDSHMEVKEAIDFVDHHWDDGDTYELNGEQLKSMYTADDMDELSEVKKMEDSAESGSKYETAESAEDDPSIWERSEFEECLEENIVDEIPEDKGARSDKTTENIVEEISEDCVKGIRKITFKDQSEINDNAEAKQAKASLESDDISPSTPISAKLESNASVMTKSMYDDSAGSSSRSSEEREDTQPVKSVSKAEGKTKKKKRKNKK